MRTSESESVKDKPENSTVVLYINTHPIEREASSLFITDKNIEKEYDPVKLGNCTLAQAREFAQLLEPRKTDIQSIRFRWNVYQSTL